jgi:hypothetical protein
MVGDDPTKYFSPVGIGFPTTTILERVQNMLKATCPEMIFQRKKQFPFWTWSTILGDKFWYMSRWKSAMLCGRIIWYQTVLRKLEGRIMCFV